MVSVKFKNFFRLTLCKSRRDDGANPNDLCGQNVDKNRNETKKTPEKRFGSLKNRVKMPYFRVFFLLRSLFDSNCHGHNY